MQTGEDVTFYFYKHYISVHGVEPSLPGFLLTNEQMLWVAMQNKKCFKGDIDDATARLVSIDGFKDAFNCTLRDRTEISIE